MDYKDKILEKVADKACNKISTKVIRNLQKMTDCMLSGDDSSLRNIWDEICVQVQGEESFYWDTYLDTVSSLILKEISSLDEEIKQAIWFQTEEGLYWEDDEEDQEDIFDEDQISEHILKEYILSAAGNWTNQRIEKYLDRDYD